MGLASGLSASNWLRGFFTEAELLDSDFSGWAADPDGDGYENTIEYALGGDPKAVSSDFDLTVTQHSDGSGNVRIDLLRAPTRLAAVDLEVSFNLEEERWFGLDPAMIVIQDSAQKLTIEFPLTNFERVFFRVKSQLIGE